jgi:hypothetical protein
MDKSLYLKINNYALAGGPATPENRSNFKISF